MPRGVVCAAPLPLMQVAPLFKVMGPRCDALRWKGMFIATEEEKNPEDADGSNFWCVYTQNCVGPDGDTVSLQTCTASRSCYDPL